MAELIIRQMTKKEQAKRIAEANRRMKAKIGSHSGKAKVRVTVSGLVIVQERIDGELIEHRSDGKMLAGQGMTGRKFRNTYREV